MGTGLSVDIGNNSDQDGFAYLATSSVTRGKPVSQLRLHHPRAAIPLGGSMEFEHVTA